MCELPAREVNGAPHRRYGDGSRASTITVIPAAAAENGDRAGPRTRSA